MIFKSAYTNQFEKDLRLCKKRNKDLQKLKDVIGLLIDNKPLPAKLKDHKLIGDFKDWIITHKDEITALQIFYAQDYRHRTFTYKMIKDLCEKLKTEKPVLAPLAVWKAYEQLEKTNGSAKNELIALVSLIRKVAGIDTT